MMRIVTDALNVRGSCARPLTYGVTTYVVIAAPLMCAGADHVTVACPFPGTADTEVGADGGPSVAALEIDEGNSIPTNASATTTKTIETRILRKPAVLCNTAILCTQRPPV